eukprot:1708936-Pyramimonas_sp.AAC.1
MIRGGCTRGAPVHVGPRGRDMRSSFVKGTRRDTQGASARFGPAGRCMQGVRSGSGAALSVSNSPNLSGGEQRNMLGNAPPP